MTSDRPRLTVWLLILAWFGLIAFAARMVVSAEVARWQREFDDDVRTIAASVRNRLDTNEAILSGFSAFLSAIDRGDSESATRYAAAAAASYPHIYMLEVARRVPLTEQRELEASLRKGWRSDFALKDFATITGQPAAARPPSDETWPILFTHPSLPVTRSIYGLRLETVGHLAAAVEQAKGSARAVASPTFELFEGGRAYILMRAVKRTERDAGSALNFFGDTMLAMLVIRTAALAPAASEVPAHSKIAWSAAFAQPEGTESLLFERSQEAAGTLERALLPRFAQRLALGNAAQPTLMYFERQLRWRDLAGFELPLVFALLAASLGLVSWLSYRHFDALDRAEREHARSAYLATHDLLTDLPNRFLFADRFGQALKHFQRDGVAFALLLVDLDHFKEINDRHGHDTGDQVLVEVARRMRSQLRDRDTVARYGGDEFVVLLAEVATTEAAAMVAEKLRAATAEPVATAAGPMRLSCSIGVAVCPEHGERLEQLITRADQAMYGAKAQGRDRVAVSAAADAVAKVAAA